MGGDPSIPSVLNQPLSVDFIEKELPRFHEAFESSYSQYDPTLKRFVASTMLERHVQDTALAGARPQPMSPKEHPSADATCTALRIPNRQRPPPLQAMLFWNKIMDKAIERFEKVSSEIPKEIVAKPDYNIRSLHTWHDIYDKLLEAMNVFNGRKSTTSKVFKKAYRYVIDKHDVARQAVDFIPDMEYISPIKAAVKLILDAAETSSTVRQAVGLAFDEQELETTFGNIEIFLAIFPGDDNIEKASIDLVASILEAVEGAIAYYLSHTVIRAVQSVSKDFKKDLLDRIGEISAKCESLRASALVSHIYSNKKGMELILQGVLTGVQGIEELRLALAGQSEQHRKLEHKLDAVNFALGLLLNGEEQRKQEIMQQMEDFMKRQSDEGPRGPIMIIHPPQPLQPPQQPTLHVNTLLQILRVSGLEENDMASIVNFEESILLEDRGRAKSIMLTNAFRAWATSTRSCELLVQGDPGRDVVEAGPALSLVSASLIQALRNQARIITLVFFCQQHENSRPSIILQSLITQLLRQSFANFTFWEHEIDLESLRRVDVGVLHLRPFFEWLVRQIPQEKTLVCVLDGIQAYDSSEYQADLRVVIESLLGLARDPFLLPALKILVTCHAGKVSMGQWFNRSGLSILEMEGLPPCGDEDAMMEVQYALSK